MGALLRDHNAAHDGYQLKEADALWVQKGYSLLPEFLKLNQGNYEAGLNQLDFKGATETSRQTINLWVEQRTDNKIRELLQREILTPETRLVLTNAIYFKGDWDMQFKKEEMKDEDFHLSATQAIKTPLMHMTKGFNYFDGGSFQTLEIAYKNKELSMIILLPKAIEGLSAFEQSLSPANMQQSLDQLRPTGKVIVTMPKFKIEAKFELGDTLMAMGMKKAFDGNMADFTGISSRKTMQRDGGNLSNLYISAVIHKAYVDVNEEGTEAAAATAVVVAMGRTGVHHPEPPIIFRADHPFMFLIRDNHSGSILFIGRVANPSTQQQTSTNVQQHDEATLPPIPSPPPPADEPLSAPMNTSPEQTGVNLLFVYKQGPIVPDNCGGQFGCGLDVYADDGTEYKKALGWEYAGSPIRASRG
jgi:serine protease inhibitor